MKATDEMIEAGSKSRPFVDREDVAAIIQAAIDADSFLSKMEYITFRDSETAGVRDTDKTVSGSEDTKL